MKTIDKVIGLQNEGITIAGTQKTPEIKFNPGLGKLEISGRSIPEHAVDFYKPLLEALKSYAEKPGPTTEVDFNLEYFNTSSSKCLYDVLKILADLNNRGEKVTVVWSYEEDDDSIKESGEDFEIITGLRFIMNPLPVAA